MYQVGPASRLIRLTEIQQLFGLSRGGVEWLLLQLKIPVIHTEDRTQTAVLAMSLELGMLGALLPGGCGLAAIEGGQGVLTENALLGFCPGTLPHWDEYRKNPVQLALLGALGSLLYGYHDEVDLKRRLWALGDLLISEATSTRKQS